MNANLRDYGPWVHLSPEIINDGCETFSVLLPLRPSVSLNIASLKVWESLGGRVLQKRGDQVSRRVCSEWLERKFAGVPRPVRSIWTVFFTNMTWISIFTSLVETSQIRTVWVSRNHATTMSWDHEEEVELIAIKKRTRRWSKSITRTIGALAEERARRVSLGEEPPADGVNSQKSCLSANVRSDAAKHVRPRSVLRRSVWPPSKSAALTRRGSSLNTQRCWGKGSNGTQDGCGECQRWANSYSNFHLINVSCRRSTCWPPWTCSRSRTLEEVRKIYFRMIMIWFLLDKFN